MYNNDNLEEIIFATLMCIFQGKKCKVEKLDYLASLMDFLSLTKTQDIFETYDEYYEDIDETLEESNSNFFSEDFYDEYDYAFSCVGILDDDDLNDYDGLLDEDDV